MDKTAATAELTAALSGEQETTDQATQDVAQANPAVEEKAGQFFELPWEGKTLKIPLNYKIPLKENGQIQEWEFGNLLNKARNAANLERKYTETSAKLKEYGDFDVFKQQKAKFDALQTWSEQNPKDWENLFNMFQNREKYLLNQDQTGGNQQLLDTITSLRQELDQIKGNFGKYDEMIQSQQDEKLKTEINNERAEFEKKFPFFDLNEKDVDGVDRFSAIIHFGASNGYPNFTSAAMAMFGDQIVKAAEDRGRKSLTEQMKKDNANGIVKRLPNGQGPTDTNRPAKMDRRQLATLELQELLSKSS